MITKKITLKLGHKLISITLKGDENLISQISRKYKKINFYCLGSLMKTSDILLFDHIKKRIENKVFLIENTMFCSDRMNTYMVICNDDDYYILNNQEVKIPLYTIPLYIKSMFMLRNLTETTNTNVYDTKSFKLIEG